MGSNLSIILTLVVIALSIRVHDYAVEKRIKQKVKSCEAEPDQKLLRLLKDELPAEYQLSKEEEPAAYEILDKFRAYMVRQYLNDGYSRECADMRMEDFFMRAVYIFLDKKSCSFTVGELAITKYVSTVNSYTNLYSLTDFGATFYKLYLAASIYIKRAGSALASPQRICNILNTRELELMNYIP